MFKWNFLCSSLCPLPLFLSLGTTEKSLFPSSWHTPLKYLDILVISHLSCLFSILPHQLLLSRQLLWDIPQIKGSFKNIPAFIKLHSWSQDFQCLVYSQSLSSSVLPLKESSRTFPPGRAQIRPDGGPDYQKVSGNRRFTMGVSSRSWECARNPNVLEGDLSWVLHLLPSLQRHRNHSSAIVFLRICPGIVTMGNLWFN